MDKKPLIGVSICAVVLLVLASLSNVVGYQTLQSSNPPTIAESIQKENTQSSNSECGCDNEGSTLWGFPILCTILYPLFAIALGLWIMGINYNLVFIIGDIAKALNCSWSNIVPEH